MNTTTKQSDAAREAGQIKATMRNKIIKINSGELQGPFITPPENGGQIVTVSYACTECYILAKTYDASDRTEKIEAFEWPEDEEGSFGPQNGAPDLGDFAGIAEIYTEK